MPIVHVLYSYLYPQRVIEADQLMQWNTSEGKNMTGLCKGIQKIDNLSCSFLIFWIPINMRMTGLCKGIPSMGQR